MGTDQALEFTEKVTEFLIRKKADMETDLSEKKNVLFRTTFSSRNGRDGRYLGALSDGGISAFKKGNTTTTSFKYWCYGFY